MALVMAPLTSARAGAPATNSFVPFTRPCQAVLVQRGDETVVAELWHSHDVRREGISVADLTDVFTLSVRPLATRPGTSETHLAWRLERTSSTLTGIDKHVLAACVPAGESRVSVVIGWQGSATNRSWYQRVEVHDVDLTAGLGSAAPPSHPVFKARGAVTSAPTATWVRWFSDPDDLLAGMSLLASDQALQVRVTVARGATVAVENVRGTTTWLSASAPSAVIESDPPEPWWKLPLPIPTTAAPQGP